MSSSCTQSKTFCQLITDQSFKVDQYADDMLRNISFPQMYTEYIPQYHTVHRSPTIPSHVQEHISPKCTYTHSSANHWSTYSFGSHIAGPSITTLDVQLGSFPSQFQVKDEDDFIVGGIVEMYV